MRVCVVWCLVFVSRCRFVDCWELVHTVSVMRDGQAEILVTEEAREDAPVELVELLLLLVVVVVVVWGGSCILVHCNGLERCWDLFVDECAGFWHRPDPPPDDG